MGNQIYRWWTGCRMRELVASESEKGEVTLIDAVTKVPVVKQPEANIKRAVARGILIPIATN